MLFDLESFLTLFGVGLGFVIFMMVWCLYHFILTPKAAHTLTAASMKKQTLLQVFKDNGTCELKRCKIHSEGYIETVEKTPEFYFLPRKAYAPKLQLTVPAPLTDSELANLSDIDKAEFKNLYAEEELAYEEMKGLESVEHDMTKVTMFQGCKVPIFVGYAGRAIAVNPGTVLGLTFDKSEVDTNVLTKLSFSKKGLVSKLEIHAAQVLLPVVPENVQRFFNKMWNPEQSKAKDRNREEYGYKKAKSMKSEKWPLILGGIGMVTGCVIAIVSLLT